MTLNQAIEEYTEARLGYDEAKAKSSEADKVFRGKKYALSQALLADALERQSKPGIKLDNGLGFSLRKQFTFSCNESNEADVKDWLHEHYGDIEEFTVQKVHKPTVANKLKTDIEGGDLDEFDIPETFNLKTEDDVACTGWKQFSEDARS